MTLKYAFRSLAKSKGFVAIAVIALGVGLGMSTTMFAVLDAVLHPYVAYREPETLFGINWWFGRRNPMSGPELYRYIRDNTTAFSAVVPQGFVGLSVKTGGGEEEVYASQVTPQFFAVTGLGVVRGRTFTASDGDDVVILSHGMWRHFFPGRKDVAGASLTMGSPSGDRNPRATYVTDRTYTVVGVTHEGTRGAQMWIPLPQAIESTAVVGWVRPMVRLKPGVTQEAAQQELKRLAMLLTDRFGAREQPFAFDLQAVDQKRPEIADIQKAMIGSALAVLLIACVNLAHLMLARGLAKRRELALRMALGATRGVVVRQMFLECALITLAGAALGVVLTLWGADFLRYRMPPEVQWVGLVRPQLSWRVFALSTLAAALSAVLFGLLPAIKTAFTVDVQDPLKDDSGTTTGRVKQRYSPLVISEVALALVLLMGGGLLLRTVWQLKSEDAGVDTRTLYRVQVWQRERGDSVAARRIREEVLTTLRGADGVSGVALSQTVGGSQAVGEMERDSTRVITWSMQSGYKVVSPDYLHLLRLPILQGRNFEPGDAVTGGVAIIDPIAAQRLYPRQDPVGKMVKLGGPMSKAPWLRVVGVVRSPRVLESRDELAPEPSVFVAAPENAVRGTIVVRTSSHDPRFASQLQPRLRQVGGVGGSWIMPWDWERQAEIVSRGFLAQVFVTMGIVALSLSALGLYGVLAYAVSRRMREFAVRMALGARPILLMKMIMHDGAVMILAGTGVGAFAALAASRYLDAVLVAVLPSDVISLLLAETLLMATGFAAAYVPARRAAAADPLDILRAV